MRELADGLVPWDWSDAEVALFGERDQEIKPTVGRYGQRHVTTELRAMYDDLVQQPIPEHVLALLARLDQT
jgi:Anti-sigma factor NepR